MTQVALKVAYPALTLLKGGKSSYEQTLSLSPSIEIRHLAVMMALLQIADGIFTAIGVSQFGISAEGNLILRHLMNQIGYLPTLLLTKSLALSIIATLCVISSRVNWVGKALQFMVTFYICGAIIPWSILLVLKGS